MFESGEGSLNGSDAMITGWGCWTNPKGTKSLELRYLGVRIIDRSHCREVYKNNGPLQQDEICASDSSNDDIPRAPCAGDSGSPLVIGERLAGLFRFRGGTGDSKVSPNRFTEISHYRHWIDQIVDYGLKIIFK